MPESARLPKVVVACTPESRPVLAEVLSGIAHAVMALSESDALRSIGPDVRMLVCTLRFDDSRMLDFLAMARERFADLPCVCCRVGESKLPEGSLHAAFECALKLGAADVIDFAALESELGRNAAMDEFRAHLTARLTRH